MAQTKPLIYVSTDIETNGPHIGKNSMLSLASAAFLENKTLVSTFTVNLDTLPNSEENPVTLDDAIEQGTVFCHMPAIPGHKKSSGF